MQRILWIHSHFTSPQYIIFFSSSYQKLIAGIYRAVLFSKPQNFNRSMILRLSQSMMYIMTWRLSTGYCGSYVSTVQVHFANNAPGYLIKQTQQSLPQHAVVPPMELLFQVGQFLTSMLLMRWRFPSTNGRQVHSH